MVERREKELTIDDMHYLFGHFACTPTVKEKQKENHKEITYKCIFYFNDGVLVVVVFMVGKLLNTSRVP